MELISSLVDNDLCLENPEYLTLKQMCFSRNHLVRRKAISVLALPNLKVSSIDLLPSFSWKIERESVIEGLLQGPFGLDALGLFPTIDIHRIGEYGPRVARNGPIGTMCTITICCQIIIMRCKGISGQTDISCASLFEVLELVMSLHTQLDFDKRSWTLLCESIVSFREVFNREDGSEEVISTKLVGLVGKCLEEIPRCIEETCDERCMTDALCGLQVLGPLLSNSSPDVIKPLIHRVFQLQAHPSEPIRERSFALSAVFQGNPQSAADVEDVPAMSPQGQHHPEETLLAELHDLLTHVTYIAKRSSEDPDFEHGSLMDCY
jgi:hypothetical protein